MEIGWGAETGQRSKGRFVKLYFFQPLPSLTQLLLQIKYQQTREKAFATFWYLLFNIT